MKANNLKRWQGDFSFCIYSHLLRLPLHFKFLSSYFTFLLAWSLLVWVSLRGSLHFVQVLSRELAADCFQSNSFPSILILHLVCRFPIYSQRQRIFKMLVDANIFFFFFWISVLHPIHWVRVEFFWERGDGGGGKGERGWRRWRQKQEDAKHAMSFHCTERVPVLCPKFASEVSWGSTIIPRT